MRGEADNLGDLALPAVLHWDLNHFVVLTKISSTWGRRRFHIHDPARGTRTLADEEFSRHFTGVVLELTKGETFQPRTERSTLRISQLWSKMSGLGGSLRSILLLSFILQLVALATPFYLQLAVDTVFPSFDADLLLMLALGFGGLMLIQALTNWLRSLLLISLGSSLSYQVVVNLYRHMLRLPLPWFEKRHVGDIISRFGSTRPIADLVAQGLIAAIIDGFMAFATLGLMFVYSPLLGGIALVAWLMFAGVKIAFFHSLRMRNVDVITTAARESSSFIESIRGIAAIKAFGQEGNRQRTWQQLKADAVNAEIRLGRLSAAFDSVGQLILAIERILFVYLAITMAMRGDFTVGMIFAFQAYKQQFLDASTRLVEQAFRYKLLDVHLNRISDIALAKSELPTGPRAETREPIRGAIELRNVGLQYGAGEPEVLRGINLKVEPGEMVALIGPSGGGKTTLLKIMMGLLQPTYGDVLVDGRPLAGIGNDQWRRSLGSVAQDDMLYAGTLAENISFFDPDIDMERVTEVARLAAIHDDILAMPMRYDTLVGDMGSALSGGQKQRILLARALYPTPSMLFADELTAHLDPPTERRINNMLAELAMTRFIVSHSSNAAKICDRQFFVTDGHLHEVRFGDEHRTGQEEGTEHPQHEIADIT